MLKDSWKLISVSYLMLLIYWIDIDLVSPALPSVVAFFHLQENSAHMIISLDLFLRCVCLFFIGPISDKMGRKALISYGGVLMVVGSALCVISIYPAEMYIGKIIQGTGCSMAMLMYSLITDKYSNKDSAAIIAFLQFLLISSIAVAPSIGSNVTYYFGWKYVFVFIGVIASIASLSSLSLSETVKKPDYKINFREIINSYKNILKKFSSIKYILIYSISIGGYVCWMVIGPFVLSDLLGMNLKQIGNFQSVITTTSAIASLIISIIIPKLGLARIFKSGLKLMYTSSILLFVTVTIMDIREKNLILLIITLFSISVDLIICSSLTLFYKSFNSQKGLAAAINTIADNTVSALILMIFGFFGKYSLTNYSILLFLISLLSFLLLNLQKRKKPSCTK